MCACVMIRPLGINHPNMPIYNLHDRRKDRMICEENITYAAHISQSFIPMSPFMKCSMRDGLRIVCDVSN